MKSEVSKMYNHRLYTIKISVNLMVVFYCATGTWTCPLKFHIVLYFILNNESTKEMMDEIEVGFKKKL